MIFKIASQLMKNKEHISKCTFILLATTTASATAFTIYTGFTTSNGFENVSYPRLCHSSLLKPRFHFQKDLLFKPLSNYKFLSFSTVKQHLCIPNHQLYHTTLCESTIDGQREDNTIATTLVSSREENDHNDYSCILSQSSMSNTNDYHFERLDEPPRSLGESHAIFGSLLGQNYIQRYKAYRIVYDKSSPIVSGASNQKPLSRNNEINNQDIHPIQVAIADIQIGHKLNGWEGVVHGGIISLLFDDALGWGTEAMSIIAKEHVNLSHTFFGPPTSISNSIDNNIQNSDFDIVVTANLTIDYRAPLPAGSSVVIRIFHDKTEGRKIYMSARMESYDGTILFSEAKALFIRVQKDSFQK